MGVRVPLRRFPRRSSRRSWSKAERAEIGPRRLRDGRETAVTRLLVHFMPDQLVVHAVEVAVVVVQLERRTPWRSVSERKRERAAVSSAAVEKRVQSSEVEKKRKVKWMRSICESIERAGSAWNRQGIKSHLSFYKSVEKK